MRAADVGVIVHNVGTAYAVHQAVCLGRPLVTRLMTLNGGAVAEPGNYEVPLGTLISDLVAFTGGTRHEPAKLVMGGPMMGTILPHMRVPVIKGTSGILLLDAAEVAASEPEACIRCGSCVKACPMGLLPLEMSAHIRNDDMDGAVDLGLSDCIACGCCAYVCPSHIPLVQYFYHAKGDLYARERGKLRTEATKKLALQRQERMEREAREKAEAAAKRKAEREAAAAAKQLLRSTPKNWENPHEHGKPDLTADCLAARAWGQYGQPYDVPGTAGAAARHAVRLLALWLAVRVSLVADHAFLCRLRGAFSEDDGAAHHGDAG
jgi:electron transport complex protein RnfC